MQEVPDDPLGLERVDREIRINRLRREIDEATGGKMIHSGNADCPPEMMEQFLEHVLAFEKGEWTTHLKQLARIGISMPPADEFDDDSLTVKLWEVIHGLARLRVYLYCTDHLSDRELYVRLATDILREEVVDLSADSNGAWHIDLLGRGSDADIKQHLRYYADEAERRRWADEFPDDEIPPHEDPPYDRDRQLPQRG